MREYKVEVTVVAHNKDWDRLGRERLSFEHSGRGVEDHHEKEHFEKLGAAAAEFAQTAVMGLARDAHEAPDPPDKPGLSAEARGRASIDPDSPQADITE